MKKIIFATLFMTAATMAQATNKTITVYQDPNCGCCSGWVDHMRASDFTVKVIKTANMGAIKTKLGVPMELGSCHTGVVDGSGQIIEGHVPANAVKKLIASPSTKGVSAPGMPLNSPGMGTMDGNLVTVDFNGKPFSQD